jgi:hypothetical protein
VNEFGEDHPLFDKIETTGWEVFVEGHVKTLQVTEIRLPAREGLNFSKPQFLADPQPLESTNHLALGPPTCLPHNDGLNKTHPFYGFPETFQIGVKGHGEGLVPRIDGINPYLS